MCVCLNKLLTMHSVNNNSKAIINNNDKAYLVGGIIFEIFDILVKVFSKTNENINKVIATTNNILEIESNIFSIGLLL